MMTITIMMIMMIMNVMHIMDDPDYYDLYHNDMGMIMTKPGHDKNSDGGMMTIGLVGDNFGNSKTENC